MSKYKQLTLSQRYQIAGLLKAGYSIFEIAIEAGVDKSTISREIIRNRGPGGYNPKLAHKKYEHRKKSSYKNCRLTSEMKEIIKEKIELNWSPEQIYGYYKRKGIKMVSHETIYKYIRKDQINGGSLYKHLRHSKKRRKRRGSKENRGQIKNRISIDERPEVVNQKSRIGDWEVDLIIGKNQKGAIVTLVERVSMLAVAIPVKSKNADEVEKAIVSALVPFAPFVFTITFDNGKEFAAHEKIAELLNAKTYFAHPYSSWERGLNENTNGLIRQYLPKKTNFENISEREIQRIIGQLNLRPRKKLGFASPAEAFEKRPSRW